MGWVGKATLRPLYPREREPLPIVQEARVDRKACMDGCRKTGPPPGSDTISVQPVASRNTDYASAAHFGTAPLTKILKT